MAKRDQSSERERQTGRGDGSTQHPTHDTHPGMCKMLCFGQRGGIKIVYDPPVHVGLGGTTEKDQVVPTTTNVTVGLQNKIQDNNHTNPFGVFFFWKTFLSQKRVSM